VGAQTSAPKSAWSYDGILFEHAELHMHDLNVNGAQVDVCPAVQCVMRVLDAHPTFVELVLSALETLAPAMPDPESVLDAMLTHTAVQAVTGPSDMRHHLTRATMAVQNRLVRACIDPGGRGALPPSPRPDAPA
jgi:hypothetical protein